MKRAHHADLARIKSLQNTVGRIFGLVGKTARQSKTVGPKAVVGPKVNT
jgi:hypothetical protein